MYKKCIEYTNNINSKEFFWVCSNNCVGVYPEEWFDTFFQKEHNVLRDGEDKEKWNLNII